MCAVSHYDIVASLAIWTGEIVSGLGICKLQLSNIVKLCTEDLVKSNHERCTHSKLGLVLKPGHTQGHMWKIIQTRITLHVPCLDAL